MKVTALATASLASLAALCGALAPAAHALDVELANQTGRANDHVYVMLSGGSSSDGKLQNNVPAKLSDIVDKRFSLAGFSGRIYFSFDAPVAFNEPNDSPTRYDKVELTYLGASNLTSVDFFGVPFEIQARAGDGTPLGTRTFQADTPTIKNALLAIPGAEGALVKTRSGDFARILSPQLSQSSYPSFDRYIASMSGQTITVRGAFFGTPFQTFAYSGTFGPDGSITLNGTITPKDGAPAPGKPLAVAGSSLPSAIYTVDGDFTVEGQPAKVSDNNVYSVIYRDLLSGFAWGYWGGRYGNDSAQWQGQPPFADARTAPADYATYNDYAGVIYRYSDSYGFSFSDTGPKDVQLDLANAATFAVTILPDGGPALGGRLTGKALLRAANVPQPGSVLDPDRGSTTVGKASCPPLCGTLRMRATHRAGKKAALTVARGKVRIRRGESRRLFHLHTRRGRNRLNRRGRLETRLSLSLERRGRVMGRAARSLVVKPD